MNMLVIKALVPTSLFALVCVTGTGSYKRLVHVTNFLNGEKSRIREFGWYPKLLEFLKRKGATYHFGKKMNPERMVLMMGGFGMLGLLTPILSDLVAGQLAVQSVLIGIALGGILFASPILLLIRMDKADDEQLLPEIKMLYANLEVQVKAGVYITDALSESYINAENPRLRDALLGLAGDIVMKSDVHAALKNLKESFDNRYIDSLCVTVTQALESGKAVDMLSDISGQIRDMENAVAEHKKGRLDRRVTLYQLIILGVMLGLIMYACMTHLFSAEVNTIFTLK